MATSIFNLNGKARIIAFTKPNLICQTAPYKHTSIIVAQTPSYWASIQADIETYIKKAIPIAPPESFLKPMAHFAFAAPRTKAPALCVAACELVGGDRSQAIAAASAIHLMHAGAHTRDNLPWTNHSKPKSNPNYSIKQEFDPNIELLMGDAIGPFGLELLARSVDLAQSNPKKIIRVVIEITRAIGPQGMIDGQFNEFELDRLNSNDLDIIEYVCKKKEGELHACGAACGAILGGGAEEDIGNLRKYGLFVGMIHGMWAKNKAGMEEKIEKLKGLALNELESFKGKNTELISSLVEPSV